MKLIIALLTVVPLLALSSCNTMQGLGEDISHGGQKLEEAASQ